MMGDAEVRSHEKKNSALGGGGSAAAAPPGRADSGRARLRGEREAEGAAGKLGPAPLSLPGASAGKKLSLPGNAGSIFRGALTNCLKTIPWQTSPAVSEPNAIFSLHLPVQQGKRARRDPVPENARPVG